MSDKSIADLMQAHLDGLTKPRGSLGRLETLALRLAEIQGRVPPRIDRSLVVVFAADHGVATEGVSLYPQEVTAQMVANFAAGGAAINVLARHCGFDVRVIDAGVAATITEVPGQLDVRKVRNGSANALREPSMSREQFDLAFGNGDQLAAEVAAAGYDLVAIGDMGIGNTTVAAAILNAFGFNLDDVVDRGTGIDEQTLARKKEIVRAMVERHAEAATPRQIAQCLGGTDSATIMGFLLGLRGHGITCVLDGFPVSASAYLAFAEDESVRKFCFAGHLSRVRGHRVVLDALRLVPIVDLGLRLGEGTGAVLGGKLLQLSAAIACEMATFGSAGVSTSTRDEEDY